MENEKKTKGSFKEFIKKNKVLFIIVASVLAALIIAGAVFGGIILMRSLNSDGGANGGSGDSKGKTEYTISLKTAGGMAMSEIDVYVYKGEKLEDMQDFKKTDEEGNVSFNLAESDKYAIVLSGVPKGYDVEESYKFDGNKADITLTSALITDEDLSTASLGLGDVMYDFTVMASDGNEVKLSDVLAEKKLVVLNFWYTTCSWCVEEFPIIDEMSKQYSDDVAVIALDPMDDANSVKTFHEQYGYSFTMASCPASWSNTFAVSGYPTSVFIDQYGVICLVESGAVTSKRPWVCAFDHFTAEEYEQKLCTGGIGDLVTQIKPSYEMPTSEEIAETINVGDITVTYRPETEDENAEYIWPFIKADKLGEKCIAASNTSIDDSYAIMYADVTLKAGQALGFDYLISSERLCDVLYVIVNDEDVFSISGVDEVEAWKSCYPVVAEEDGTYEVALCYLKDSDGSEGDDTVYIDNMRVVSESEIDVATYLPRYAAKSTDGETYTYVNIVYNETDGYYHVDSADGPILLADLMDYTLFNEEETIQDIVYNGEADKDGVSLYNKKAEGGLGMVEYFSYASNSSLMGICPVTEDLRTMLEQVAEVAGFTEDEYEWLKICKYFQAYGEGTPQLTDPIKGLATFSAYTATLGTDVESNYFYYDRAIIPRGTFAKFVPEQSGVYRFTSKSDYQDGIEAWIFNDAGEVIYTFERDERMYQDPINCSMVYYMEAGSSYYINMAFWDIYATGYIYYDVEFEGESIELFRLCAPGYFTYDSDAQGDVMYDIIAGGITPELRDDGYYYDSEDGSLIYADFTALTPIFSQSILEMIEMGGFDFSKSETDGEIIAYLNQNDGDVEKTREYLKKYWGEEYDKNAELYMIDDVFEGRYHGDGPDLTEEVRTYAAMIDKSGTELDGCVPVDQRLAEILQYLMDKYTFEDVENSWLKICFYYDYLGPAK